MVDAQIYVDDHVRSGDRAMQRPHGGDRKSEDAPIKDNNGNLDPEKPVGNERSYALRRLRKDRPDLHAEVIAGKKSPHAAMVEAGFRPKTVTVPLEAEKAARTLAMQA